jgi:hypothetical protein
MALAVLVLGGAPACQSSDRTDRGSPAAQPASTPASTGTAPQAGTAPRVVVTRDNPCSVLLPSEVADILGVPIALRDIVDDVTCHFDYEKPDADGPEYFEMKVHFTGGQTAILATRMASRMLGGDAGFEKLSGIGDEAWLGPMASTLVFVKGDVGVELDLRMVPDGRAKGVRLATLIASRL